MSMTLKWYGPKVKAEVRAGAAVGLLRCALHLQEESRRIVPIDKGTLMRSSRASVDALEGAAAVCYDTPYAPKQHEDLTLNHKAGKSAKYLEIPLNAMKLDGSFNRIMADYIGKGM